MKKIKTICWVILAAAAVLFVPPFLSRADGDVTPPVITSFSITPETVDTSSGSQTLTLTMAIEDAASDICISTESGDNCPGTSQARLQSIGSEFLDFYSFHRVSGDAKSGTYTSTATLPQGSRLGPWSLQYIYAIDSSDNYRLYSPWTYPSNVVCGLGNNCIMDVFSSISGISGTVIGNSGSTDSFSIDAEYSMINPSDGTKVIFPAGTTITRESGGSFEIYKLVSQEATISGLTASGLSGNVAEVLELGIPGLKLAFSQPVRVDLKVDESLEGKKLTIKSLGEGDASWINEGSCRVDSEFCSFTINHASYFTALSKKKIKTTGTKLSFSAKKRIKRSSVKLKIKSNKYAILTISVNGSIQKIATASRKGKYSTRMNLDIGQNTVTVAAKNDNNTLTKSRIVTRR